MRTTQITKKKLLAYITTALQERDRDPELDNVDTMSLLEDAVTDSFHYLTGTVWEKGAKHHRKGSIRPKRQSNTPQRRTPSHRALRELAQLIVKRWAQHLADPDNPVDIDDVIASLENYTKLAKYALELETRI